MMNGDTTEVAEAVNGAMSTLVDNADVVTGVYCSCLQLVDMQIGLSCVLFCFVIYRRARIPRRRLTRFIPGNAHVEGLSN
jgi:hypothetical protein